MLFGLGPWDDFGRWGGLGPLGGLGTWKGLGHSGGGLSPLRDDLVPSRGWLG